MLQATLGAQQAKQTQTTLQNSLKHVQEENEKLHKELNRSRDEARLTHQRLSQDLLQIEKELQNYKIQVEANAETMERYESDKAAAEKQISHYKRRIASLEQRLEHITLSNLSSAGSTAATAVAATTTDPSASNNDSGNNNSKQHQFTVPPLQQHQKQPPNNGDGENESYTAVESNNNNITNANGNKRCCLCLKNASGMMKQCQCGKKCGHFAHLVCANRIQVSTSVSHPGTPAPRLPLVLCQATTSNNE